MFPSASPATAPLRSRPGDHDLARPVQRAVSPSRNLQRRGASDRLLDHLHRFVLQDDFVGGDRILVQPLEIGFADRSGSFGAGTVNTGVVGNPAQLAAIRRSTRDPSLAVEVVLVALRS